MRIKQGFTLRSVAGEYIVAGEGLQQVNFNKLIALNASAAYLWREVEGKEFDIELLAGLLMAKYGLPAGQAMGDASGIAGEWVKSGIAET
ncbi:PqqD family protein [Proteiniphilum sp.]|uniref:PqqD family protein n=1 Tax=Proteiniphilum sp. TaxID=1926877 RepID=UPI002B20F7CE|nr:PqqD family protein [Proteiniphilum sp.]MEA4917641.1 PqqD family protein [Proteiniphilum sp.]